MPGTDWDRRHFDIGDLHPHRNTPDRAGVRDWHRHRAELAKFGTGSEGAGEMQTWEYRQALGQNRHLIVSPRDGTTTVEAPSNFPGGFSPGQRVLVAKQRSGVVILGHPPGGDRNHSVNVTAENPPGELQAVEIRSMDPAEIEQGTTNAAHTITGDGFTAAIVATFSPVVDDGDGGTVAAPGVSFSSLSFIDTNTASVLVTATSTAAVGYVRISYET